MVDEHRRWRAELAAYLLGALEPNETADLERHLAGCDRCRDELDWLRPAIDLLPESTTQLEPPPALRARLLAEVRSDAAELGAGVAAKPGAAAARKRWRRGAWLRPATALAALALVAAAVAGYALNGGDSGPATTTFHGQGAGSLRAALERSGDSGTLKLTGLRQAPASHVYQAWVQQGRRIKPISLFDARHNGTASVSLEHQLDGAKAVMVTVEPRGGSRQPTSPTIVNVAMQR